MAQEVEAGAMKRVRPRLRRQVHDAAVETAELGRRAVALDLELLDRVDDRIDRHLPRLRLQHRDAVEQVLVGSRPAAVDARQQRVGRQRDPGGQAGERDEGAAVQRQLHHLLVTDDGAEAGGLGAEDRRLCRDGELLADVADGQIEIDARLLAGRQVDAGTAHRLEAGEHDVDAVLAGRQARRRVDAVAAGDHDPPAIGADLGHRERRAGDRASGGILHQAGDFTGGELGERP